MFVFASLFMLALGAMPLSAHAQTFTETQIDSISELLLSFGADEAMVSSIESTLRGVTSEISVTPPEPPVVTVEVVKVPPQDLGAAVYFGPLDFIVAYSEAFDHNLAETIGAMVYMPESLYETMSRVPNILATLSLVPAKAMAASLSEALYETGLY